MAKPTHNTEDIMQMKEMQQQLGQELEQAEKAIKQALNSSSPEEMQNAFKAVQQAKEQLKQAQQTVKQNIME